MTRLLRIWRIAETYNSASQPDGTVKTFYAAWTLKQNRVVDTEPAELNGCGRYHRENFAKDQPVVHTPYAMVVLVQKAGDVWA